MWKLKRIFAGRIWPWFCCVRRSLPPSDKERPNYGKA